jgi:NAD-dependent SIR2 family protein deacetylase
LADLSVWCHACNGYLRHADLDPLVKKLEELKFDTEEEASQEDEVAAASTQTNYSDSSSDEEQDGGRGVPIDVEVEDEEEEVEYPFGSVPTNLEDVARFIQSDTCRSIVVLAGAGMSVASGIPDFRSVGGLYDTLQPDVLTASQVEKEAIRADPTVALEQGLFLRNPLPLLEVIRPFILGTQKEEWKATIAHRFMELLHQKTGKLTRLYTQNIDGLEGQCHLLPRDKVVAVHGSFDRAECALCQTTSDFDEFCTLVQENIKDITGQDEMAPRSSTPILCHLCGHAAVKPSIVLFRSSLPQEFFDCVPQDISKVDLLIVIGTSLAVAPANTLVFRIPPTALRVVVNDEPVGWRLGIEYGSHAKRDYFAQGHCDAVMLDLIEHLGWMDDLAPLVDQLPEESAKRVRDRLYCDESDSMTNE